MLTSEEYYYRFVRSNLDQAIEELQREPRRIYSIGCIFILRLYRDRFLEQRERIHSFVNEGRLHLTSSSVTTAPVMNEASIESNPTISGSRVEIWLRMLMHMSRVSNARRPS
jgi:hypothetical protein